MDRHRNGGVFCAVVLSRHAAKTQQPGARELLGLIGELGFQRFNQVR